MSSGMGALSEMEGGYAAYRISKAALNAVLGFSPRSWRRLDRGERDVSRLGQDRLGGAHAERHVSQGAETAVWLALDAPQDLTGQFMRDHQVIPW